MIKGVWADKKHLREKAYNDDSRLRVRKEFNRFSVPRVDIGAEVIKSIDLKRAERILDVGCGYGDFLIKLRKNSGFTGELFGLDISYGILMLGIEQNRKERLDINFMVADAESLPFMDGSFDVITAKHMLYHLPDIRKGISEMHRCLRTGGRLVISLNSINRRPKFQEIERRLCKKYGLSVKHATEIMNVENIEPCLSEFSKLNTRICRSRIELSEHGPFVEYFNSFRDFYTPFPDNRTWSRVLKDVEGIVNKEIEASGRFTDQNDIGITVAVK